MKVLVAEKPSVARDHYKKLLERQKGESFQQKNGYLQGKEYIITWCVGHLVTLAPFDQYEGYGGSWKLSNLPLLPEQFKLEVIERSSQQFHIVQGLLQQADEIINGADAGREGNLIFDLLIDYNPQLNQKTLKRFWVNSYVEQDLDRAWQSLEDITHRVNLSYAARLRQRADWLVGLNATRAYTLTAGGGSLISVGRVQTPTLNLIVQRDSDVEGFKELFYYGIASKWSDVEFKWIRDDKIHWDEDKPYVEKHLKAFQGKSAQLTEFKKSTKKSFPPKPFDLTELQKEANKKLKLKAARTLEVAQVLYEKKLITYPRTDSAYLPENMKGQAYQLARSMAPPECLNLMRPESEQFQFINSKKVTDHYAILPTGTRGQGLSAEEQKLLGLITERFVIAWLKPQIWTEAQATIQVNDIPEKELFRTKLKVEKQAGWKSLKRSDEDDKNESSEAKETSLWLQELPEWTTGTSLPLEELSLQEKKKPKPKYYTEATLLTAMKSAGRQIEDEELAEAMKERGLGTPATQAGIIETLKHRNFITEEKGFLMSTVNGRRLIEQVDSMLKSPELTGEWEYKLKQVEKGEFDPKAFYDQTCDYVHEIFSGLKNRFLSSFERENIDWSSKGNCLKCQAELQSQNWGLKCSQETCDFSLPFSVAGRQFETHEIEQLLKGESFDKLEGFRSKRGFQFSAGIKWSEEFKLDLQFDEDPDRKFSPSKHKCPACKSLLDENKKMLRCSQERCQFIMWKTVAQRPLKKSEITTILKKKTTDTLEGFISKKGKEFQAKLKMDAQFKISFEFDNSPPPPIPCPKCAKSLFETNIQFHCACGWKTHKVLGSRTLSRSELEQILKQGKSKRLKGFQGRDGTPFSTFLILDSDKQIQFDIDAIKKET